jgi:hypothetical protein
LVQGSVVVIEQSRLLPTRVPWRQFPELIVHSSIHKLKSSFGYFTAKRGNHRTALRIAHALVKQSRIELPIDFVVPVIQVDKGHYNALPVALAAVLAKHLGAQLWLEACQINKVNHTGANALDRLRNQPVFGGPVPTGRCLICDDVVTFGASLANLRGFLVSTGAEVVAATAIGAAYGSTKLAPDRTLIGKLRDRYDREIETQTASLGFGCECLTAREAYFLAGLRTAERLRDCLAQEIGAADRTRGARCRI